jgi:hypothetical protein
MIDTKTFREPTMQPDMPPYRSEAFAEDLPDLQQGLPTLRHGAGLRLAPGGARQPLRQGPYRRDTDRQALRPVRQQAADR